jgi:GntR family transcriptional regulator
MSSTGIPVYLRLRELIVAAIIEGTYPEGSLLPSVRAFAAEHGANPLTVAKAYQQLQNDALVEVQRGVGMFVTAGASERLRRLECDRFLAQEWPAIRRKLVLLGLSPGELLGGA